MRRLATDYDQQCRNEFKLLYSRVASYFITIDIGCPYGLPQVASFHQASFAPLGERAMELFLASGFRRNGNCLYEMHCRECNACLPIRLNPEEFKPNRNQRRAWKKNADLEKAIVPLRYDQENLELCERFLRARYPIKSNTAAGYYRDFFINTIVHSAQIEFRLHGKLLGTSIIDVGYNWINAVYFFFDPNQGHRSLGTYNILHLIQLCREWEIDYLYLGYLIHNVSAMSYKSRFRPHYIFQDGIWKPGERYRSLSENSL